MNFNLDVIVNNAVIAVPLVVAIVQAMKLTGWVKDHFAPLLAILVGIGISFLGANEVNLSTILLSGVVMGLISSGLYSGVKTTMVANARLKQKRMEESAKKDSQNNRDNY